MAYQPKSYRKFVATAATATLVATAFAPFASAHSFKDVEEKYNEAVDFLVSKGVTGYTDGTFKTQKTITRLEAAEMLGKALGLAEVTDAPASGFTDVPARVATLINAFKAKGIDLAAIVIQHYMVFGFRLNNVFVDSVSVHI